MKPITAPSGLVLVSMLAAFWVIAGCSGDSTEPPPPIDCTSVADTTQPATVSYQNDIFPLFLPEKYGCNNGGCHGAPIVSSNFSVSTYESLFEAGDEARAIRMCSIKPGDPDQSYLYWKVQGRIGIRGERMPLQMPPMTASDLELVRVWILEGARNN